MDRTYTYCISGVVSSAAYKKWEKAAIAGVSLVADAAEHLERTATDKELEQNQITSGESLAYLFFSIIYYGKSTASWLIEIYSRYRFFSSDFQATKRVLILLDKFCVLCQLFLKILLWRAI